MKTAVIVQARMTSSRLPGKSMMDLCGKPVIQHVLERCTKIGADVVVLAVPIGAESLPMAMVAQKLGCEWVYGDEHDVLSRYVKAAKHVNADIIMRVTGDCPMIDPKVCGRVMGALGDSGYISNVHPERTYPKGFDCEVFTMEALLDTDERTTHPLDREHVTLGMVKKWRKHGFTQPHDESHINYCIDTQEDLDRMRGVMSLRLESVYGRKGAEHFLYGMLDERDMDHAISHKELPTWEKHCGFVHSKPYLAWYLIENDGGVLGNIYLTANREVGIFLYSGAQGQRIGTLALEMLRMQHPGPLYANISPNNEGSMRFFGRHGFKHIQNTLKLEG